jgi:hypothetical protein
MPASHPEGTRDLLRLVVPLTPDITLFQIPDALHDSTVTI